MANYFAEGFRQDARTMAVEKAIRDLASVEFDTIVCRGTSGAAVAPIVAYLTGKKIVFVRKSAESSHSGSIIAGDMGSKYVIIDDFIETGSTVQTILDILNSNTRATCVGFWGYGAGWVEETSADEIADYTKEKLRKGGVANLTRPESKDWQKTYNAAKYKT